MVFSCILVLIQYKKHAIFRLTYTPVLRTISRKVDNLYHPGVKVRKTKKGFKKSFSKVEIAFVPKIKKKK